MDKLVRETTRPWFETRVSIAGWSPVCSLVDTLNVSDPTVTCVVRPTAIAAYVSRLSRRLEPMRLVKF